MDLVNLGEIMWWIGDKGMSSLVQWNVRIQSFEAWFKSAV
jgi:hypothetical protein